MAERRLTIIEKKILAELVRNPRISDNKISSETGIAVNTVSRKRRFLEANNIITYISHLDFGPMPAGTGGFQARQLYILIMKQGISRASFESFFRKGTKTEFLAKHVQSSYLGEDNGRLSIVMILESRVEPDIIEIFNTELLPWIEAEFGKNSVFDVRSMTLTVPLQLSHNYFPTINMQYGLMKNKQEWQNDNLFVG